MPNDIDAITHAIREALAAGPTPGPWLVSVGDNYSIEATSVPREWPHAALFAGDSLGPWVAHVGNHQADFGRIDADFIDACNPQAIATLLAGLEALGKDAERYRLLRRGQHWSVVDGIGDTLRAEALDDAIDQKVRR